MNHHPKLQAAGRAQTPSASRYLQQLCKHWSRKGKAEFDASKGSVVFHNGNQISLKASSEDLVISATIGKDGDIERWKTVIEEHLVRFAFREEFKIDWGN